MRAAVRRRHRFCGGLAGLFQSGTVGEGSDTDSLQLPGVQEELLRRIIATGTSTVIVVTSGRPHSLNGLEEQAAAVLMAFQPGQEGGEALADLVTGKGKPERAPGSFIPKNVGAVPYYYNHKIKSGGTPIAYHFGTSCVWLRTELYPIRLWRIADQRKSNQQQ